MIVRQCWIAIVLCLSCPSCFAVCTFLLIFLFFHPFTSPSCTYSLLCQPRALLVSLLLLLPPQQGSPPLPPLTMLSGDEDHELDQPPQESIGSLSSLLDTESKFRAFNPDSESTSTLDRPVDRALAMFDMPQMAPAAQSRPEDDWGYRPPSKATFSKTGQVDKNKHFAQELSLGSFKDALPSQVSLPQKPIWMEKYTTISSTSKPENLLMCIKDHFQKAEIDFEFVKDDSKIKALCGNQGRRCKFNVRLFRGDGEGEVLVEFQRRCGDILAFTSLYRNVLESLGQADLIKGPKKTPAASAAATSSVEKPLEIPADLAELSLEELSLDAAAVQSLYDMAECELVDVQREGLSALASVTVDSQANQAKLVGSQDRIIHILRSVLDSADEEINHTGAVLLANVSSQASIQKNLTEQLLPPIVALMGAGVTLANKDTKRYLARALLNLSNPKNVGELKQSKDFAAVEKVLSVCLKLEDKALNDIVGQIQLLLKA